MPAKTVLLVCLLLSGFGACPEQPPTPQGPPPKAGSTCAGANDCPADQVCSAGRCRYRKTSAAGEVLSTAAHAQLEQGDVGAAVRTYDEALDAYKAAAAPEPPRVLCGAAVAALREASTPDGRERAARRADACLRGSLPGDPMRHQVLSALTRLRYEGLDMSHFDKATPADRFFTKEPQRPTVDAIEIAVDLPESEEAGFDKVAQALRGGDATRAIANCFVEDWERRHERHVRGSLVIKMTSKLRDMGYYDSYESTLEVATAGDKPSGFDTCVAEALTEALKESAKVGKRATWQQPFEIAARVQ